MSDWLGWTKHHDLSGRRGNGPFPGGYLHGVVLHVNVSGPGSQGTSPEWYESGGGQYEVCPNFQVMKDGTTYQFLPLNWEPWTQMDGNSWGPSIETGGDPDEPLTAAQIRSCGAIMRAYHQTYGVPLEVADSLSDRGLGTHQMGGAAWGGHPCPGEIRAGQRKDILAAAGGTPDPFTQLMEQIMSWYKTKADFESAMSELMDKAVEGGPLNAFNLDAKGDRRTIGTWLAGVPDYVAPKPRKGNGKRRHGK